MKRHRKLWIWLLSVFSVLLVLAGVCAIYILDYYPADTAAMEAFKPEVAVEQTVLSDGTIIYEPNGAIAGLIFYPGGKVEHTAYIPLMQTLASHGILSVLVEMPLRLAVFDINAADDIIELFPNIDNWYIGGHSLGGSMAASSLSDHKNDFKGLILLGSYSTKDLSNTNLSVLSIYGSEDKVLNMKKYIKNKANLPDDFTEIVLDGGCHAYFGMYGKQDGDGTPSMSNEEQIRLTADAILELIQ